MQKFRIIIAAVFVIAALFGIFNRVSASISTMPWWKTGGIILISAVMLMLILSSIKRSAGKIKEKEKAKENSASANVKN